MVIFTGDTVEGAINKGLAELGITKTKASIRVISRGKKGFLGFGKKPAQVDVEVISRTTVSQADQEVVRNLPRAMSKRQVSDDSLKQEAIEARKVTSIIKYLEERGQVVNDTVKSEILDAKRSVTAILSDLLPDEIVEEYRRKKEELDQEDIDWEEELREEADVLPLNTVTTAEISDPKPQNQENLDVVEVSGEESATNVGSEAVELDSFESFVANEFDQVESPQSKDIEEAAEAVTAYVEKIIYEMDVEASLETTHSNRRITIQIETPEAGRVIGYHGKVLKSLQVLTQNFLHDHYSRSFSVSVNVHDYVERRIETLIDFTQRIADRVLDSGQPYTMDNMSNDERKIVHKTIAKIDGVESYSEGSDPHRYVVVTLNE
ncbi:RNA-binding cell elongation regulator Jag/EloR [Streptococcus dentapri]|uniref:RNA-binding protein KhpB n=1 Tax=Streptococcus dentapri TaxID=573564 RepID=A0ABV8D2C6_9STRE